MGEWRISDRKPATIGVKGVTRPCSGRVDHSTVSGKSKKVSEAARKRAAKRNSRHRNR